MIPTKVQAPTTSHPSATHCDTDDGVAGWRVQIAWSLGNIVVVKQRHHVRQRGEGDVGHTVGLLDVDDGFDYLLRTTTEGFRIITSPKARNETVA